ncbi:hypothetical protein AMJ40_02265, partial [candidate division TA06 bacterium DG_26]
NTSVSRLSSDELRQLCGLPLPEVIGRKLPLPLRTADSAWDWRDRNGENWMTPIRNQGNCGSCWAFGALGVLEPMVKLYWDDAEFPIDLSEQYLVSCSNGSCNGYTLSGTADFLQSDGATDEDCFPYQAADLPCEDRCADWYRRLTKIESWGWVAAESVKSALEDGPLYTGMVVYPSFRYYTGGVYESLPDESPLGGHAVVICGWNDADSCWICKNSWGRAWGEDGWFRIKWGDSDLGYDNIAMIPVWGLDYVSYEFDDGPYGDGDGVFNPDEEVVLTVTLQNKGDTVYAVTAALSGSDSAVTITDSAGTYGDILPLAFATNSSDPFQLQTVVVGQTALRVEVSGSDKDPFTRTLDFSIVISLDQSHWPVELSEGALSSPAIVDMDGDDYREIVIAGSDGHLYVKTIDTSDKSGFPFSPGEDVIASPAVGDLEGDGHFEIVLCTVRGLVYVLSDSGDVVLQKSLPSLVYATPVLSDLDNDGTLEIIVGCMDGSLHVFTKDGSYHSGFPVMLGGVVAAGVAVADLKGDRLKDMVVPNANDTVYAVSSSGTVLWKFGTGSRVRSAPSVANINGLKVVVGSWDGNLYILNSNGTEHATVTTEAAIKTSPSFADLDGDGILEIVFSAGTKTFVCEEDGNVLPNWPQVAQSQIQSSACFADLDGDDGPEVIFGSDHGSLYAYKPDGSLLHYFPLPIGASITTSPAVSDLDRDGDAEIIFGSDAGIHVVDCKSIAGRDYYWDMHRGNPQRTGCYGDFVSVTEQASADPHRVCLYQNYPNPFERTTVVQYELSRPAAVNLSIYNLMGQKVTILARGLREAGLHREYWNGQDPDGKRVSSGVYFCRLETETFRQTKKIVLLDKRL